MPVAPKQEIKLFYCYAREDKALRDELELHLSNLKRQYHLTNWHDREILPGEDWEEAIDVHLNRAHVIFLLVSPHFMASDYCYGKEMDKALEREKGGTCCVIPILLRPTDWEDAPFSHLQLLPTDARPVTSWPDRDSAFWNIAKETRKAIKKLLLTLKTKEEWLEEGKTFYNRMRYEEALTAFDQAVRLDPNNADAYNGKGTALFDLMRYEEALIAFDQTIRLDPNFAIAHRNRGVALHNLQRYEEALIAFDRAISLDPNFAIAYYNKGNTLYGLMRHEEALAAFDQATRLKPDFVNAYMAKGGILGMFGRYEEALSTCEQAIRLDPNNTVAYLNKGSALGSLSRHNEELATYEQAIRLDPNFAPAYYNKGITLKNLGKIKEAEQAFEKARQLGFIN